MSEKKIISNMKKEEIKELIELMKSSGVYEFSYKGLNVKFIPELVFKASISPEVESKDSKELTEEEIKKLEKQEEEELLYGSSNS
jgi:NH3-dependent NAD+ synthetase